jgi:hypothetical protein
MRDSFARILAATALVAAIAASVVASLPQPQFTPDVAAFVNKAFEASSVSNRVRQALEDADKKAKAAEAEAAKLREELAKAKEVK